MVGTARAVTVTARVPIIVPVPVAALVLARRIVPATRRRRPATAGRRATRAVSLAVAARVKSPRSRGRRTGPLCSCVRHTKRGGIQEPDTRAPGGYAPRFSGCHPGRCAYYASRDRRHPHLGGPRTPRRQSWSCSIRDGERRGGHQILTVGWTQSAERGCHSAQDDHTYTARPGASVSISGGGCGGVGEDEYSSHGARALDV